jgi:uncharacterized membrane protein YjjB (DUF3815 family)
MKMELQTIALHFVAALAASYSFALLFNSPKQQRFFGGLTGAIGWIIYRFTLHSGSSRLFSTFIAAVAVGIISEISGRTRKAPVTIFLLPGIIPLVPGADAYLAMLAFSSGDWASGLDITVKTLFLAGAIAGGTILTGSFSKFYRRTRT